MGWLGWIGMKRHAVPKNALSDLMDAAGRGDMEKAQKLVASGVDVNERSKSGFTALMFADEIDQTGLVILDVGIEGAGVVDAL